MITREAYLKNPCGTLSVPYWKWIGMEVPEHMRIIHHRDWNGEEPGEPYFRVMHDLKKIPPMDTGGYEIVTATEADFETISRVVNCCYPGMHMDGLRLRQLTQTPAYDPELWILVRQRHSGTIAGCAIADLDEACREGIIEWVQVLPEYRRQGIGMLMVSCLLEKMRSKADFATVSGKLDNVTCPEKLYRKCGFMGDDIWHIIR